MVDAREKENVYNFLGQSVSWGKGSRGIEF